MTTLAIGFFGASLLLSLFLTRIMIRLAPALGLIDQPGERRIHTNPIPRAGGIAIWLTVMVLSACYVLTQPNVLGSLNFRWFRGYLMAAGLLFVIGIIDDRRGVNAWLKLLVHAASAAILFFNKGGNVGSILGYEVHWIVDLGIWVVWTVTLINAFNLIDGMDGLCAGLATISLCCLAALSFASGRASDGVVILIVIGSLLGFLKYNFYPAKIFLGDTGSMFIGFTIASLASFSTGERFTLASLLLPIAVAGVPLIDVLLAIWRRSFRSWLSKLGIGKAAKVFGPDQNHLHHRLLSYGLTQRKVAMILYGLALLGAIVSILPSVLDERAFGVTFAAFMVIFLIGFRYLAPVELMISGRVLDLIIKRPAKGKLTRLGFTIYDIACIALTAFAAYLLEANGKISKLSIAEHASVISVITACGIFALNLAKAHSRRWSRASLRDFASVIIWLSIGYIVAATVNILITDYTYETIRVHIISYGAALALILIPRGITPMTRESVIDSLHRNLGSSRARRNRVIVYGAGDLGELFIHHVKITAKDHFGDLRIVGFIDDQKELRGKFFDGFRIRGDLNDLPYLKERFNLYGLIIAVSTLSEIDLKNVYDLCSDLGLSCYTWTPNLSLQKNVS